MLFSCFTTSPSLRQSAWTAERSWSFQSIFQISAFPRSESLKRVLEKNLAVPLRDFVVIKRKCGRHCKVDSVGAVQGLRVHGVRFARVYGRAHIPEWDYEGLHVQG